MSEEKFNELRVSVDVGYRRHSVAIGLPSGEVLEEFEIEHRLEGFQDFFSRIEKHNYKQDHCVAVAMEGYNGYARPLDSMVRQHGYRLYNINNLKLARFKEIFPGSAKSDRIDARKGLELFQLRDHLPLAKEVLQEGFGDTQAQRSAQTVDPAPPALGQRAGAGGQQPTGGLAGGMSGTVRDHFGGEQPVVLKLSSQCTDSATAGPA